MLKVVGNPHSAHAQGLHCSGCRAQNSQLQSVQLTGQIIQNLDLVFIIKLCGKKSFLPFIALIIARCVIIATNFFTMF